MKWAKGYDVDFLLAELSKAREVTGDGGYRLSPGTHIEIIQGALSSAIVDKQNPKYLKARAIQFAIAAQQNMSRGDFERFYRKSISDLRAKYNNYVVVHPIWCDSSLLKGKLTIGECRIDLSPTQGTKRWTQVIGAREKQRQDYEDLFKTGFATFEDRNLVHCFVRALSPHGAQEVATEALSEYLGSLSMTEGRGKRYTVYNGFSQPLSGIILGPQITIHSINGKLAFDNFYFGSWNPKWFHPKNYDQEDAVNIISDSKVMLRAALKSPWADRARLALRLYYDAVSEHDATSSFLACWRVLELVGGVPGANNEILVERAAKLFRNYKLFIALGTHLKDQRNLLTHQDQQTSTGRQSLAFQAMTLLTPLLELYVTNYMKFRSESELWEFCDVSRDKAVRARSAQLLRQAERIFCKAFDGRDHPTAPPAP